ncbi:hypothetical protein SDRG_05802 [Saprolegnia diclina VS20]|uniref:Uncharacterized protein n=1 Tax=Saprolegnia diclina (strain VS20) TaxID=1156394 RepID=T0QQI5_SAPDV|nr:hypothetical protein SDRG_05802 [Saprolegnia diclina VS20]EQC36981.1 hypothetical protein SDRG_05802 [Saprolegnia diclina VS20]|eukprot:XP_008609762.1 hypothetical protein SDRG_05802 [Saprolegnia diclina VS20]
MATRQAPGSATSSKAPTEDDREKESTVWSSDGEKEDKTLSEDKKTRRRAQIAKSARKHRIRQKQELIGLRNQVQELTEALAKARRGPSAHRGVVQKTGSIEIALGAAEMEMSHSLRGLWLNAPLQVDTGPGPNVYHPFHHLGVDPVKRIAMLSEIARPGPARMYTQVMEDTRSIPSFPPYVDVRMTSMGENVSIKFCRVCEITSFDHRTVSEVFWDIFWGFDAQGVVDNPGLCRRKLLMQVDSNTHYEHIAYTVPNMPEVRLESLDVVTRLHHPQYSIFTWESVDRDDLVPSPSDPHTIRREEVGGVLFQTETDADGCIRTVLRTVIYSRPFVRTLPKIFGDMNEPFAHMYCRLNVIAEEQVSRHLLQKFMTS